GPRRPQDRVALTKVKENFAAELTKLQVTAKPKAGVSTTATSLPVSGESVPAAPAGAEEAAAHLHNGSVGIAAITSCTNTSNPSVMLAAGLLAKKAVEKGLKSQPWVKTSLSPGSKVVTEYYNKAGLTPYLEKLGFFLTSYGCSTCIGNSGPLAD